jgi:hypothetical protein
MAKIIKVEDLKCWTDSGDPFLVELAQYYIGKELPVDYDKREQIGVGPRGTPVYATFNGLQELATVLDFLNTFAIGYAEMKISKMRELYDRRITLFIHGLSKMGYSREPGEETLGALEKIIRIGAGKSCHRMLDLERYTQTVKK